MTGGAEPLVRRGKRNARFTAISNDLIDHPDLSPEARIVLIYLLSKPDNWKLQIDDIRRLLGTGKKACGRNKTYEVIRELRSCAHVIAVEELQGGRFHRMTYFVFDEPHCDPEGFARAVREGRDYEANSGDSGQNAGSTPRTENRDTAAAPCPEKPCPENRHVIKEREIQKTESPHPTPVERAESGERREGGHSEFSDLWSAWPEAERPRKRPVAERLFKRLAPDERRSAARFATTFRAVCIGRGASALMIPYFASGRFANSLAAQKSTARAILSYVRSARSGLLGLLTTEPG